MGTAEATAETAELAKEPRGREAATARRAEVADAFRYCLKVFLVVRLGLALVALVGVAVVPAAVGGGTHGITPGWHNVWDAWNRWDAGWFIEIATYGYGASSGSAAFFPLYPVTVRGVSWLLGHNPLAASLIVSNLAFLGALVVLYLLTRDEFDDHTARRSIVYLAIFPTAFFFVAPYSESLFLLLAVTALWSARRGNWGIAGVAGALASATRSIGVALVVPLFIEVLRQTRAKPGRSLGDLLWGLACTALVPMGMVLYLAYWEGATGDWLAPVREQGLWLREFVWPWETLLSGTKEAFRWIGSFPGGYHLLDWLLFLPVLAAAVWVARRAALSFAAYTWISLLAPLSFAFGGRPFMSVARFALVMFPLFWAFARFADRWRAHDVVIAFSAGGLAVASLLFVTGYWVF